MLLPENSYEFSLELLISLEFLFEDFTVLDTLQEFLLDKKGGDKNHD